MILISNVCTRKECLLPVSSAAQTSFHAEFICRLVGFNYLEAEAHVLTFTVNNYHDQDDKRLAKALAWEKKYLEFVENYVRTQAEDNGMMIAYSAEVCLIIDLKHIYLFLCYFMGRYL